MVTPMVPPGLALYEELHSEYITCVRFDNTGRRMATSSADGVVRIRDLDDSGLWHVKEGCELKATHLGTVWKLDWAHQNFGQVLATCSQDRTVRIWEEYSSCAHQGDRGGQPRGLQRWIHVASFAESRYGVCDIRFAPHHLGLRIASASEDGEVRIHKSTDPSNVGSWQHELSFVPCAEGSIVTCVCWCPSPFDRPVLAVGTISGLLQIWSNDGNKDDFGTWFKVLDLPGHDSRAVSCLEWSRQFGRSFHRIVSCGADGKAQVHKVTSRRGSEGDEWKHDHTQRLHAGGKKGEAGGSATQAQWNFAGTSLTTTGDDGAIRLWGIDLEGNWTCSGVVHEPSVVRKSPMPSLPNGPAAGRGGGAVSSGPSMSPPTPQSHAMLSDP